MGRRRNLLVVAPDARLRASIAFLLRAEGYDVTASEQIPRPGTEWLPAPCAILDEEALAGRPDAWAALRELAGSFVMVVSKARPSPTELLTRQVVKPLLGQMLVEAVNAAIRDVSGSST